MSLGEISNYKVERETDLGYIISDDGIEYFLHHNECDGNSYKPGDIVSAFIYKDKKDRLAATVRLPLITTTRFGMCEVVEIYPTGVFINVGIAKDLMLSKFELPMNKANWPHIKDKLPCIMFIKDNKLFAKIVNKSMFKLVEKEKLLGVGDKVKAYVYRIIPEGINLVDDSYNVFFIYKANLHKEYHLGEELTIRVSAVNPEDYNATVDIDKSLQIDEDAMTILNYLTTHGGTMVFTSKSSADTINRVFSMSKVAFKNALGRLYKQQKVQLYDDKTTLI